MNHAHVLILEDDPLSSAILEGWLHHIGATVTVAATTAEADTALAAHRFDLILSDVQLPGNCMLEWVERVLQTDFPPPLVLLTGNPQLESAVKAANLPVAGYLVKPPDFRSLQELLQRLVISHRHRQQLRELSREAASLGDQPAETGPGQESLQGKLQHLARCLLAESNQPTRDAHGIGGNFSWRTVIGETIDVLEKTKHSFRSKELGQLRQRLQQMLVRSEAA
jgi:DNA-binding NtrC family response regulator